MAIGARSPGITYQELLDTDTHEVPEVLRLESPRYLGSDDISTERYTSREWHEREVERLWKRVWQFACREEHIPHVGSLHRLRHRQPLVHRHAHSTRRDQGLLQRLSSPRASAQGLTPAAATRSAARITGSPGRSTGRSPMCRRGGTSITSPTTRSACPRRRSARGPGSCSSTPIPIAHPSASTSAISPPSSSAGISATATSRATSPR